jgi:PUA-domain protein
MADASIKIKNRYRLKEKDVIALLKTLRSIFDQDFFDRSSIVEHACIEEFNVIIVDKTVAFFTMNDRIFFTLHGLYRYKPDAYRVIIDMGAVKHIVNGADIMAPGIIDADRNIKEHDQVWVCDEKNKKPLAVGVALRSGSEMLSNRTGKAVRNIHHVGDRLWNITSHLNL